MSIRIGEAQLVLFEVQRLHSSPHNLQATPARRAESQEVARDEPGGQERSNQVALEDEPRGSYRCAGGHYSLKCECFEAQFRTQYARSGLSGLRF